MLIEISLASGVCTHMYSKIVSSFINVFWVVCFGWFYIILSPNDKCKPKASKIKRYRTHNGHIQCIECTTCANYIGFNTISKSYMHMNLFLILLNANTIQVIWERKSVHRHRYTSVQSSYYYHIVYTVYSILHRFNLWQDINGNMIRISYWMRSLLLLRTAATAAAMLKHVPFKTTATEKPVYCFENAFRSSRCWSSCF